MHRPPFTSADLAVLRSAHAHATHIQSTHVQSRSRLPAQPQRELQPSQPERQRPFWGLLAQKLGALLAESPPGVARLTLPERDGRREV